MSLDNIFKRLHLTPENGLFVKKNDKWIKPLPRRLEEKINVIVPDALFLFDEKPLILFFDRPQDIEECFKRIWNYNESPIIIINKVDSVEIYNGFSYLKDELSLDKLAEETDLDDFSYFELVSGKSLIHYNSKLKQQNRVDAHLLKNIQDARNILIDKYQVDPNFANALIGKCIFARYLIDRKVKLNFENEKKIWKREDLSNLLKNKTKTIQFFNYLKSQFNGEAFLLNDYRLKEVPSDAFIVLSELMNGTDLIDGQQSLFDIYDFSIIPVEFISNVYEYFIGKENQAKKGAYYTPKFLVDYIISETVEKYFKENPKEYNCKVLDPSCGSGIFLVETLRKIIERYCELNDVQASTKKFVKSLNQIAEDNIFGIDADSNAVNVAVFSIYLTLLDYQEPKDIEKFKFPNLIENGNFFTADFFDLEAGFNSQFNKIDFNFVLGNPPWKGGALKDALFYLYIKARKKKEGKTKPHCEISNKEIAQAFLLRTSDFSSQQTKCALIVTSKTLYNLHAKKFRSYFLHNFFIDKVFELAPVRREIFDKSADKAIAPAAILFFRFSNFERTDSNKLVHLTLKPNPLFSLFKIFVLQRSDIKKIAQKKLMDHDWLWKVLVYGSYLDFNFIKRLEENYITINDIISDSKRYLVKQGLKRKDGKKKINVEELINWEFLDINVRGKIEPFFIAPKLERWTEKYVGYIHRENGKIVQNVFKPPVLLLKETVSPSLTSIPVISTERKILFTDKVTSIKAIGSNEKQNYHQLAGLLYSKLFSYYILLKSSTVGIMIEQQVNDKEKWQFPFVDDIKIAQEVKKIESITNTIYEEKQKVLSQRESELEIEKDIRINKLNEVIFNSFDMNEEEFSLVSYSTDITIPLIMKHKGYENRLFSSMQNNSKIINEYTNIILARFKNSLDEKQLKATIWYTSEIIGIFFKVESNNSSKKTIEWIEKDNNGLMKKITSLGIEKITENLFIQKDIRGFEKDGFYIIKPNEKYLWHKAIAYLDVDEFMDSILQSGQESHFV